jgi:hypothetical protein
MCHDWRIASIILASLRSSAKMLDSKHCVFDKPLMPQSKNMQAMGGRAFEARFFHDENLPLFAQGDRALWTEVYMELQRVTLGPPGL